MNILISGKRDFDYEKEELFFLKFTKLFFFIFALIFIWGVYSHYQQFNLIEHGTAVLAEAHKYKGGEQIKYIAEDGVTYRQNIFGMFVEDHEDTIMVYYLDHPADAAPLTSSKFFYILYTFTILGMLFFGWQIKRTAKSLRANRITTPDH